MRTGVDTSGKVGAEGWATVIDDEAEAAEEEAEAAEAEAEEEEEEEEVEEDKEEDTVVVALGVTGMAGGRFMLSCWRFFVCEHDPSKILLRCIVRYI